MEVSFNLIESEIDLGDIKRNVATNFQFVGNLVADSPQLFKVEGTCGCTNMNTDFIASPGKVVIEGVLTGRHQLGIGRKKVKIKKPVEKELFFRYNVI